MVDFLEQWIGLITLGFPLLVAVGLVLLFLWVVHEAQVWREPRNGLERLRQSLWRGFQFGRRKSSGTRPELRSLKSPTFGGWNGLRWWN